MRREEHDKIIENGIAVNQKLLDSPTLETITQIVITTKRMLLLLLSFK